MPSGARRPRRYWRRNPGYGGGPAGSRGNGGAGRLEPAVHGGIGARRPRRYWSPPSSAVLEPAVLGGIGARRPRRYLGYGGGPPAPGETAAKAAWSPPSTAVLEPAVLGGIWDTAEDRRLQGKRRRRPPGARRPRRYLGYGGGPPAPGCAAAKAAWSPPSSAVLEPAVLGGIGARRPRRYWSPPSTAVSGIRRRTAGSRMCGGEGRLEEPLFRRHWQSDRGRGRVACWQHTPGGALWLRPDSGHAP
jgi:hypothetical protein